MWDYLATFHHYRWARCKHMRMRPRVTILLWGPLDVKANLKQQLKQDNVSFLTSRCQLFQRVPWFEFKDTSDHFWPLLSLKLYRKSLGGNHLDSVSYDTHRSTSSFQKFLLMVFSSAPTLVHSESDLVFVCLYILSYIFFFFPHCGQQWEVVHRLWQVREANLDS